MSEDYELASRVLGEMTEQRVSRVTDMEFEWSPGRSDARYTGDKTAFDIYIKYEGHSGERGFLGIEVKYHENLEDYKNRYRPRYDEVAAAMGCFRDEVLATLRRPGPLQQMWRDHLLVGSHHEVDGFDESYSVFLYPEVNSACSSAVESYTSCLSNLDTFAAWTLDDFVACLARHTDAEWVRLFHKRYLDLSRLPV